MNENNDTNVVVSKAEYAALIEARTRLNVLRDTMDRMIERQSGDYMEKAIVDILVTNIADMDDSLPM